MRSLKIFTFGIIHARDFLELEYCRHCNNCFLFLFFYKQVPATEKHFKMMIADWASNKIRLPGRV